MINIIAKKAQSEEVLREMITFLEGYSDKEDVLHLLNLGRIYHFMWIEHGRRQEYFNKAEGYYEETLKRGPKLPPALYGILDLYRVGENVKQTEIYANKILELWPEDKQTIELLKRIKLIKNQ